MNTSKLPTERSNRPGRPSKFTPQLRARVVQLIAKGVPFKHASRAVGISFVTLSTYREQHPDFAEEIDAAVTAAIEKRLDVIERAADAGDVNSAKWLLEHLHPESFAKTRIEFSGADGQPLAQIAIILPAKDQLPGTAPVTIDDVPAKEIANGE